MADNLSSLHRFGLCTDISIYKGSFQRIAKAQVCLLTASDLLEGGGLFHVYVSKDEDIYYYCQKEKENAKRIPIDMSIHRTH